MIKDYLKYLALGIFLSSVLAGCGGGGTGGSGGNSGGSSSGSSRNNAVNEITITVDSGPTQREHNTPYATVTLCRTGTTICETIDHVLVDTGSSGLRILSQALSSNFKSNLSQRQVEGGSLVQCMQFVSGSSWGPVKGADVKIGNYTVTNMAVQIIGDSSFPTLPSSCSSTGTELNTIEDLGANGILGIGHGVQDCGGFCAQFTTNLYYTCTSANACQPVAVPLTEQVHNPVALFSTDNNGTLLQLPALPGGYASSVEGSLFFGVGTRANNAVASSATIIDVDPSDYIFTAQINGLMYSFSAIDSGTTDWVFDDNSTMSRCPSGYYCPFSAQNFTAALTGSNNTTGSFNFSIANITGAPDGSVALNNSGGPANDSRFFLAGLPFFYGRSVWTTIENTSTPAGTGPFVAFE